MALMKIKNGARAVNVYKTYGKNDPVHQIKESENHVFLIIKRETENYFRVIVNGHNGLVFKSSLEEI
jgi:hypothetical protein